MTLGRVAGLTDTGRKRRRNEDAFVCEPPLFAVADGMGGAQAGEIASRLAAAALSEDAGGSLRGEERVAALIREANRRVYERQSEEAAMRGMGTTITVALTEDDRVSIGHVGDSRAYLIRDGRLDQLTDDHSLVAELVRSGKLSPEEAETHPQRSVITRALGTDPEVDVDTFSVEARAGDLFLLCSDGLTSMVDDEAILAIIERHRHHLEGAARALVNAANRGGGEDNITVVFLEMAGAADSTGETAELPATGERQEGRDDEDTLSGLDGLPALEAAPPGPESVPADELALSGPEREPALDTMVIPAERVDEWLAATDGAAQATAVRGRRPLRRRLLVGLTAVAVLGALAALALWGLSQAHFIGAEPNGHVAIYQGLPYDIVGRARLYRVVYVSPLLAAQLTHDERRRLFGHDLRSYRSSLHTLQSYERKALP